MTKERYKAVLDAYEKVADLSPDRIQRMYEDWQQERETCGCSEAAADLVDVMFIVALHEAEKKGGRRYDRKRT